MLLTNLKILANYFHYLGLEKNFCLDWNMNLRLSGYNQIRLSGSYSSYYYFLE
jgi:hypothetical protein